MTLAQIVTQPATKDQTISIMELALAGGWLMIPIVLSSFVAIYIFIERVITINKANESPDAFIGKIKELVLKGDITAAKMLCNQHDTPVARMIEKGVSRIGSPLKIELFKLEKNLSVLATVSGAAPMMGFLGTVIGMVQAFISIAQEEGSVSPKLLADGIYTAMITTVAGLIVGIIAYLGYNFLVTRVSKVVNKMEYSAIEFIDLLQEPR
jgi:biopolymer transport protein ExbB